MVDRTPLPRISWDENPNPEEIQRASELIAATLTNPLALPSPGETRLFFLVPTPAPYAKAEAKLLATVEEVRAVALPHAGRCYALAGVEGFRAVLPHAFDLGPPELTFIAANCGFDLSATEDDIARFVGQVLAKEPSAAKGKVVGMHFDSGDLVELF